MSAKKAIRASKKKHEHNLFWKKRIKTAQKNMAVPTKPEDKAEGYNTLQSLLDKAAKNKVIHKNKASRLKSRYAKRLNTLV